MISGSKINGTKPHKHVRLQTKCLIILTKKDEKIPNIINVTTLILSITMNRFVFLTTYSLFNNCLPFFQCTAFARGITKKPASLRNQVNLELALNPSIPNIDLRSSKNQDRRSLFLNENVQEQFFLSLYSSHACTLLTRKRKNSFFFNYHMMSKTSRLATQPNVQCENTTPTFQTDQSTHIDLFMFVW